MRVRMPNSIWRRRLLDHQGSSALPADGQFAMVMTDTSVVGIGPAAPMDNSPSASVPTAESLNPSFWGHSPLPQNLDFGSSSSVNCASTVKLEATPSTGMLLPTLPAAIYSTLPPFLADSAFIERAAMFSSSSGGNVGSCSSVGPTPSTAPYRKIETRMAEDERAVAVAVSNRAGHEERFDDGNRNTNANSTDAAGDSSPSDVGAKKRKMNNQDIEMDQAPQGILSSLNATNGSPEAKLNKADMNSKVGQGTSEEDYVHIRARRGQATNSHSLAERVRREKISERMKYLQDLVPGCSKVTGKAVVLDEIINYVRSLQRQVEFLSMKLAAVSPRLHCNIEDLLAKDGMVSTIQQCFQPLLHPFQQCPRPAGVDSGMVNPSDAFRKVLNAPLNTMSGYEDARCKILRMKEQHNSMQQMAYDSNAQEFG